MLLLTRLTGGEGLGEGARAMSSGEVQELVSESCPGLLGGGESR